MILKDLTQFYIRDLNKLQQELSLYKQENDIWILNGNIKNSAGTLILHLIGNLKHFIGAELGKTGYVRQRDKEFADRNISRDVMTKEIDEVIALIEKILSKLSDDDLKNEFPSEFLGEKRSIGYMLLVLSTHLNYHLGQINYHRRLCC